MISKHKHSEHVDGTLTPLGDRPEYSEPLQELQELERLHAQREADKRRLLARARGAKIKRSATERAADLLKGGRVDAMPLGPALAAIDQELAILRDAIGEKTRQLDVIATDFAFSESQKLLPQFNGHMRAALQAMEALSSAFNSAAGLADALRRNGYRPSSVLLPDLMPSAARVLGDLDSQNSEAFRFRRELQDRGIVS
jgi:hypothetical protein